MSFRRDKQWSIKGIDVNRKTADQITDIFHTVLDEGIHGLCYSAYEEGQKPGTILTVDQIRRRMAIIAPYTKWIRSFSCIEGNELIPQVAREFGLKTLVGAWIGPDESKNADEMAALIELADQGFVDIAAVGNEVMYRQDLSEKELLSHLYQVKAALANIPVGYVDPYYEFSHRPNITEACDVILINCYPFWEHCPVEYSLFYIKEMYHRAQRVADNKKVIISETGWPNTGSPYGGAIPSPDNALDYFINAYQWADEEGIDIFYFSSFDESWKVGDEGDVGAYWGLWDKDEQLKF